MAKTTGTTPRMVFPDGSERPIIRLGGASIREQIGAIELAGKYGIHALVLECMAVNPENQWVCEHDIVRSHIGVITNARFDHADLMGSRLDQIASCLANTIPRNGRLVTAESEYLHILKDRARDMGTSVDHADPETVTEDDLAGFTYFPFKDNVAIALEVCRQMGVDRETALRGMQQAPADPGVLRVCRCDIGGKQAVFANALAANDISSTRQIWDSVTSQHPGVQKVLLICARRDRRARSMDFVKAVQSGWEFDLLILAGEGTAAMRRRVQAGGIPSSRIVDLGAGMPAVIPGNIVHNLPEESVIVAAGNIVGLGEMIANFFFERGVYERVCPDIVPGTDSLPDSV